MGMSSGSSNQSSQGYSYNSSLAQSLNASNANVWGGQSGALTNMYGQAQNLANTQAPQVASAANAWGGRAQAAGQSGVDALSRIAQGQGPLASFANPNSELAKKQLAGATADITQNFNRNVLPSIRSGAGMAGGVGSSREALARGVAAGDAGRSIAQAGTDIYSNMYNTAASAAAGLQDSMSGAASALPTAASQLFNLGMSPFSAAWGPLQSLAGILGGPTVLSNSYGLSQAQSLGESAQTSQGASRNFGFSFF